MRAAARKTSGARREGRTSGLGLRRVRRLWRFCRPAMRLHRRHLVGGMATALGIVLVRLSLPWPLAHLVKPWFKHPEGGTGSVAQGVTLFFALFTLLGLLDFLSRYLFARFAIDCLRDLREEAVRRIEADPRRTKDRYFGDLISRLVGDTARIREGLKGFLIHVVTSAMLFVGIIAMLLWMDPLLAGVMSVALAAVVLVTVVMARRVFEKASHLRQREGLLASSIERATRGRGSLARDYRVKPSKGFHSATLTKMRERTTWAVHGIMGAAFLVSFYVATHGSSPLSDKELFVFLAYALTLHHPVVRLSRQGTRVGKLVACLSRLEKLVRPVDATKAAAGLPPLREGITLRSVVVRDPKSARQRLGPIDLRIRSGEKLAVCGATASGKSTLLEALVRTRPLAEGSVHWDDVRLDELGRSARATRMEYLPQEVGRFDGRERRSARQGPDEAAPWSAERGSGEVLVLDDPVRAMEPAEARACLEGLATSAREETLVVALSRLADARPFERLVLLEHGRVVFDGPPAEHLDRAGVA